MTVLRSDRVLLDELILRTANVVEEMGFFLDHSDHGRKSWNTQRGGHMADILSDSLFGDVPDLDSTKVAPPGWYSG